MSHDAGKRASPRFDMVGAIIAYEQGELDQEATLELFQVLVNNGMAWTLQGSYGRMAQGLLNAGLIQPKD